MEEYDDKGRWEYRAPNHVLIIFSEKDMEDIKSHMEYTRRFKSGAASVSMSISDKVEVYYYNDNVKVVSDPDSDIPSNMSLGEFVLPTSDRLLVRDTIAYYTGEDDAGNIVESFPFNLEDLKDIKEWDPDLDK